MPKPKQAIVLRVHRNVAGVSFPWDCVYFFRQAEESLLSKVFPCSMVLVMTDSLTHLVKKAVENPRGDLEPSQSYPHYRGDEHKLAAQVKRKSPMATVLENPKNYVALIPTLHLKGDHNEGTSGPVYLTARPRALAPQSMSNKRRQIRTSILRKLMGEAMTSQAYFLFHGDKIQPVCLSCPNNLEFLDGKCIFGEEKCYASLDQAKHSDFVEARFLYKQIVLGKDEPEVTDE
jgi:hypothetical protein